MVDLGLILAYILVGVCTLASVIMPMLKILHNPDSLKKMVVGVGVVAAIFFISFAISAGDEYEKASVGMSKLVGAGLTTMYVLAFVALAGIVFTEVKKIIE